MRTAKEIESEVDNRPESWARMLKRAEASKDSTITVSVKRLRALLAMRDELVRRDADQAGEWFTDTAAHDWHCDGGCGLMIPGGDTYWSRHFPGIGHMVHCKKCHERLAAARTPVERDCDICGKHAPHRPDEGLCIACADELVRCNERLEAREARTPEVVEGEADRV